MNRKGSDQGNLSPSQKEKNLMLLSECACSSQWLAPFIDLVHLFGKLISKRRYA
jgi:hypothetical protein